MSNKNKRYPWSHAQRGDEPIAEAVYAGPSLSEEDPDAAMNDVYAGPEFFGISEEPEDPEDNEETEVIDGDSPDDCVNSSEGTPDLTPPSDSAMFMAVYAGPDYFSGVSSNIGAYMDSPESAESPVKKGRFCHECGSPVGEKARFCSACGVRLIDEQN